MEESDSLKAQTELCREMYLLFSSLVTELTDLCIQSQLALEQYSRNLGEKLIPDQVRYW